MCSTFNKYPYWESHGLLPIMYNTDVTAITYCVRDPKPLSSSVIHQQDSQDPEKLGYSRYGSCIKKIQNRNSKRKRSDPEEKSRRNQTWVSRCPLPAEYHETAFHSPPEVWQLSGVANQRHLPACLKFLLEVSQIGANTQATNFSYSVSSPTRTQTVWPRAPGGNKSHCYHKPSGIAQGCRDTLIRQDIPKVQRLVSPRSQSRASLFFVMCMVWVPPASWVSCARQHPTPTELTLYCTLTMRWL